jgi:maleate isomerase
VYGERGRIGLIVPSSNTVCEPEMAMLCPRGVATYSARILFEPTISGLKAMKDHVEKASLELSSEGICDIIAFCCTVGSMMDGPHYDQEIIRRIEETSGVPAITTTSAVKASLDALGVIRVAVATPYTVEIDELEKRLLEMMGYQVTNIIGYHEHVSPENFRNDMIGRLLPEEAYNLGMKVTDGRNEAIFISCTNFRAIEIIQRLEDNTGKFVISSNQATMWHAIRKLAIQDPKKGYGRLFDIA